MKTEYHTCDWRCCELTRKIAKELDRLVDENAPLNEQLTIMMVLSEAIARHQYNLPQNEEANALLGLTEETLVMSALEETLQNAGMESDIDRDLLISVYLEGDYYGQTIDEL